MDMGSYTQNMYDWMINEAEEGYDVEDDYSVLLDKINSNDFFEPFSARLLRYLSKHEGEDFSPESQISRPCGCAAGTGVLERGDHRDQGSR